MYYQLGRGGRVIWTTVVFLCWCYVTWQLLNWTITSGMGLGDEFRFWLRSAGLAPALSDFLKLTIAIVGFFGIPLLTTTVIVLLNKKLKGSPHEQEG
jgi:hypothetical protein